MNPATPKENEFLFAGQEERTRRKINNGLNIVSHVLYLFALPSFSPSLSKGGGENREDDEFEICDEKENAQKIPCFLCMKLASKAMFHI